jgi:hypothetical protein
MRSDERQGALRGGGAFPCGGWGGVWQHTPLPPQRLLGGGSPEGIYGASTRGNLEHPPQTHNMCDASQAKCAILRNLRISTTLITRVPKPYVLMRFRAHKVLARKCASKLHTRKHMSTVCWHTWCEFLDFARVSLGRRRKSYEFPGDVSSHRACSHGAAAAAHAAASPG